MFVVCDTETTGLPRRYDAPHTDLENWPRIIQLAFAVYDQHGKQIHSFASLIKPEGWTVPTEKFWIENGYSQEQNEREGLPIRYCIEELVLAINGNPYLVAHNMSYDRPIIASEMYRLGLGVANKPKLICTKDSSTAYCKLPSKNGRGYKWPKLEELHIHLFGVPFQGAHDAGNDVAACGKCLFELINRKVISI